MNGFNLAEIVPKILFMMRDGGHRSRPVSVGKSLTLFFVPGPKIIKI